MEVKSEKNTNAHKDGFSFEDLQKTISSIADGIISIDINGNIMFMNEAAQTLTGWTLDEANKMKSSEVFKLAHFLTGESIDDPFEKVIKTGIQTGLGSYHALVSKDGKKKLLSANIAPIRSECDVISGAVGVFRDITRLKKIEDELRDERNNLRTIFQYAPIGLVIVDQDSRILDVNNGFLTMIGREIDFVKDKLLGDGISCEHSIHYGCKRGAKCVICDLQIAIGNVINTAEPVNNCNIAYNLVNDGIFTKHDFKISAVPIKISDENCAMLVIEDITKQKKIQNQLKANEAKYRNLFMNMLNGFAYHKIVLNDENKPIDYIFLEVNDEFGKMIGLRKEDIVGKRASEIFGDLSKTDFNMIDKYGKVALGGEVIRFEQQLTQNEDRWVSFLIYSNEREYFSVICSDISEEKRAQREMKRAMEATNAAYKAKSEFLANMSHEIRTPLNGVVGMVDLTLSTDLTPIQKDNLKTAKACADSLLRIINDVLDFSKLEAGKMIVEKIRFDIKLICNNIIKFHTLKAQEKGLRLYCDIDDKIPQYLIGDPIRLSQVLNNLISNSLKFTEKGSVRVDITLIRKDKNNVSVKFKTIDTGIGISKEDMDKLFKSFTQVDGSHTRKYGGTGLGLVISKQILNIMGGDIDVKSEKGVGSSFSFTLDFGIGNGNNTKCSQDEKISKSDIDAHILVVEDDKINQVVICRMLDEMGYTYDVANNGVEAIQKVLRKAYDLCIMDIQMPEMDGIQATRLIRESKLKIEKHLPIIALTAYALHGDRERFLSLGMDDYLSKPINLQEFYKKIEKLLMKGREFNVEEDADIECESDNSSPKYETSDSMELILIKSEELTKAMIDKDVYSIEIIAHEIKELAVDINRDALKTLAFRIELAARREDLNEALLLNNELENLIRGE
ncbi:MAG: PAS domain S-box protein [Bacillota bacterium]|nr:PAS domain S-box protein [Bacillota bacterium]